jgi:hypothetical protein
MANAAAIHPLKVYQMNAPFRVHIGWDRRALGAYDVSAFSLQQRASAPAEIQPIKLDDMQTRQV